MLCSRIQLRWSDFMGEICKNRYRHLCGLFQVCRPFMFTSNEKYTIFGHFYSTYKTQNYIHTTKPLLCSGKKTLQSSCKYHLSSSNEKSNKPSNNHKKNNSNNSRRKPYAKQIMTKIGNGRPSMLKHMRLR